MTATTTQDPTVDEARQGAFIGRLFNAGIGAIELVTIDIGERRCHRWVLETKQFASRRQNFPGHRFGFRPFAFVAQDNT